MKEQIVEFPIDEICEKLKIKINNPSLLKTAFTHSAYANVYKKVSNQRMEFLGDSVVGLVVSDYVYNNSKLNEGELTRIKSQFVSEIALSKAIDIIGVNKYLLVNQGSLSQELHKKTSVKADLYESIVAAIYLDSGLEVARAFVFETLSLSAKSLKQFLAESNDYKTQLQELLQQGGKVKISYQTLLHRSSSAHEPTFRSTLIVNGEIKSVATGSSKRRAEQMAAEQALTKYTKRKIPKIKKD